jgi:hypothetical protein
MFVAPYSGTQSMRVVVDGAILNLTGASRCSARHRISYHLYGDAMANAVTSTPLRHKNRSPLIAGCGFFPAGAFTLW